MTKKIATLVGCAIGDALGNPFEMWKAERQELVDWNGQFKSGGTFWVGEAGQYTDDTLMSIALSKSILQQGEFDPDDVAAEYLAWYNTGNTRGIGTTTARACDRLKQGADYSESGIVMGYDDQPAAGNGTAMRATPIGLVYRNQIDRLMEYAMLDAMITHNNLEPKMGSIAVALATAYLANETHDPVMCLAEIKDIVFDSIVKEKLELAYAHLVEYRTPPMEALASIGVGGYVPETVGAAFYCLAATTNFKDAVVLAVKAGGDTDTTAAIVGALAGTYYGLDGIPDEYKEGVENFQLLQDLTDELINIEL